MKQRVPLKFGERVIGHADVDLDTGEALLRVDDVHVERFISDNENFSLSVYSKDGTSKDVSIIGTGALND